jgi:23S rRNA A1618 N6-methylase RlmF
MCNPPFYESREDVLHSADIKELEPRAVGQEFALHLISWN